MSDLISRSKIRNYIKTQINPYGKAFEGTPYELGLEIMKYIDSMHSAYDVEKVVSELLKEIRKVEDDWHSEYGYYSGRKKAYHKAIDIVRKGGVE